VPAASRVLIVEDDDELREFMRTAVSDAGYEVVAVVDGEAALEACRRRDPDVILLDLGLPRLDGEGFVREYRRLPESGGKIIVISGTPTAGEIAGRVHARVFLSKPFELTRLLDLLRATVDAADN
jgi:two-component system KDP operon response regulator KdpE